MAKKTQDIEEFTRLAMTHVPRPWDEDLRLAVFRAIQNDEILKRRYQTLVRKWEPEDGRNKGYVNATVSAYIGALSGGVSGDRTPAPQGMLIGSYRKLNTG